MWLSCSSSLICEFVSRNNQSVSSVAQSCLISLRSHGLQHAGLPVHHQLPELTQTHVHLVSDAIQHSHPLSSLLLPASIFPSIRVFSNESVLLIRWPKYWSFSLSISPSSEYSGLISFRTDLLDLLAVQGTLKSLFNTTVQKHQFFNTAYLKMSSHFRICIWTWQYILNFFYYFDLISDIFAFD